MKYSIVFLIPSLISTFGSQFNSRFATEISGFLCNGSSDGNSLYTTFDFVSTNSNTILAKSLIGLSAANHDPENMSEVNDLFSQKYLAIHSVNAKIFEWLYAGFYETSVYGGRFEPAYIIPAPYMVTQGLSGFDDNVLMGLSLTVKPRKNFSWITDIYLDDLGVNEMVKLNFDTKIRGTFQTGINYVPLNLEQISMIRLNYTAVTPYMYTHKQNLINNVDFK